MTYCHQCGAENDEDVVTCSSCEQPLRADAGPPAPGGSRIWDQATVVPDPQAAGPGDPLSLSAAVTEVPLETDQVLAGRYRLKRILGIGGMGQVYLATDESLQEECAIKVVRDLFQQDQSVLQRLKTETRLCRKLSHESIVRVHHYEDSQTPPFLVMEYVEGGTLADRLAREEQLEEAEACRIGAAIAEALAYAHGKGVIHRDLKPGNVLLSPSGDVKVADFGIARLARDSTARLTGAMSPGTLAYMGPEEVMGDTSAASDLYALGVVLYELVTGKPPFTTGDVNQQIMEREVEPLVGVSQEFATLVQQLLEKDPDKRPASAEVVRDALGGTSGHEARDRDDTSPKPWWSRPAIMASAVVVLGLAVVAFLVQGPLQRNAANAAIATLEFVSIEPGSYSEPAPQGGPETIYITQPFFLQHTEVTQGLWEAVMGDNPSEFSDCGADCPVERMSWDEIQEFIERLNSLDPGKGYRLPTQAEWTYAALAGDVAEDLTEQHLARTAWYNETSSDQLHPVATREANAWGLYDMLGNVKEWVDLPLASASDQKMILGGFWYATWEELVQLVFFGEGQYSHVRSSEYGFRLVRAQ